MQNPKSDRFLRLPEICERLGGVHKSTVYRNLSHLLREVMPGVTGITETEFVEYQQSRPSIQKPQLTERLLEGRAKAKATGEPPKRGRPRKTPGGMAGGMSSTP